MHRSVLLASAQARPSSRDAQTEPCTSTLAMTDELVQSAI